MSSIKSWINKKFPNSKIIILGELTEKISGVSKVRVGKNRTINSYYEITLNEINNEGLIVLNDGIKKTEPANESAINTQNLQVGDLIFPKTFTKYKSIKIGRIDKKYDDYVIANNSMIRISFPNTKIKLLPKFIQYYLQHSVVQDYLYSVSRSDRRQIQINDLKFLPVPELTEYELLNIIKKIDHNQASVKIANIILEKMNKLLELQNDLQNDSIFLQNTDSANCDFKIIDKQVNECLKELLLKKLDY